MDTKPYWHKDEASGRCFTVRGDEGSQRALETTMVKRWLRGLPADFDSWYVGLNPTVVGVGTPHERVLFVHALVSGKDRKTGLNRVITSFLTGDAVGCFIGLRCEGELYALLVEQYRPSVGRNVIEIVAGMMDDSNSPLAKALEEIREETGLHVPAPHLALLSPNPFIVSGGHSDELLYLLATTVHVTREQLASLAGQVHGNADENERTKLIVMPIDDVHTVTQDMKTALALMLYNQSYGLSA